MKKTFRIGCFPVMVVLWSALFFTTVLQTPPISNSASDPLRVRPEAQGLFLIYLMGIVVLFAPAKGLRWLWDRLEEYPTGSEDEQDDPTGRDT